MVVLTLTYLRSISPLTRGAIISHQPSTTIEHLPLLFQVWWELDELGRRYNIPSARFTVYTRYVLVRYCKIKTTRDLMTVDVERSMFVRETEGVAAAWRNIMAA